MLYLFLPLSPSLPFLLSLLFVVLVVLAILVVATKLSKKQKTIVTVCCWCSNSNFTIHVPIAVCLLRLDVVVSVGVWENVWFLRTARLKSGRCFVSPCFCSVIDSKCKIILIFLEFTPCRDPWDGNRRNRVQSMDSVPPSTFWDHRYFSSFLSFWRDGIMPFLFPFLFPQFALYLKLFQWPYCHWLCPYLAPREGPLSRCSTEWTRSRIDFDLARPGEGMRHTPHVQFSNPSGQHLEHDGHCFLGNFAQLIHLKGSQSLTCLFGFLTELVESFFLTQVWNDRFCLICRSKLVHEFWHFGHSSLIFEHCILWNSLNLGDPQFPSAGGLPLLESGPCCWCCYNLLPGMFEFYLWSETRRGNSLMFTCSILKGYHFFDAVGLALTRERNPCLPKLQPFVLVPWPNGSSRRRWWGFRSLLWCTFFGFDQSFLHVSSASSTKGSGEVTRCCLSPFFRVLSTCDESCLTDWVRSQRGPSVMQEFYPIWVERWHDALQWRENTRERCCSSCKIEIELCQSDSEKACLLSFWKPCRSLGPIDFLWTAPSDSRSAKSRCRTKFVTFFEILYSGVLPFTSPKAGKSFHFLLLTGIKISEWLFLAETHESPLCLIISRTVSRRIYDSLIPIFWRVIWIMTW